MPRDLLAALTALAVVVTAGCSEDEAPFVDEPGRCAEFDELRQVYWGDTHVHTDLSFDANMQGTRTTQDDAYAFARGETIPVQPYDETGTPTRSATIDRPLDFVMLSDHAEFLGTLAVCNDPSSAGFDADQCQEYRTAQEFDATQTEVNSIFVQINGLTAREQDNVTYPTLCDPAELCLDAGTQVWRDTVARAEAAYDRSDRCELTTFPGYEWSGGPRGRNLHRNVMFKDANVTEFPYSYLEEPYPEGLWARLQTECIDAETGCDVLTIPHNSNFSEGIYFERANEQPFTEAYVELRNAMEPVIEIYQHKGASECLPGAATADELCGFEIAPYANIATADQELITPPDPRGYLRQAYGDGMALENTLGTNPFKYGITAATDTHISASGFVAEDEFKGHGGAGQPNRFLPPPEGFPDNEFFSPGGLTAVWAEENARPAIFDAFRRKETFGTSGPRIVVRMFGGWEYAAELCDADDLAAQGYTGGVPMGGTLGPRVGSGGPRLVVLARQDPIGLPLQRIQIVKGWLEGGEYQVQVYDVAGDPNNGATVSLDSCEPSGAGDADLCNVWEDPDFDPAERAYYYARVLENPSCRWTTLQCAAAEYDCNDWDFEACQTLKRDEQRSNYTCDCCDPASGLNQAFCESVDCSEPSRISKDLEACCAEDHRRSIQERAWTSPIWYDPPG
jgi:hypothetical protein